MATVRVTIVNRTGQEHPADADRRRCIYAFWHEALLAPVKFRVRVRVLISRHADGELIAQAAQRLGFGVVRGSTTRGGGEALVALWDCSESAHVVFTPDGPRGPRRRVQPGVVALAARSGLPIVPVGIAYAREWRARSWDRFMIPWPFTHCVLVGLQEVFVPPDLDRDGLERARRAVEEHMLAATAEAERVARGRDGDRDGDGRAELGRGPHAHDRGARGDKERTSAWTETS
jgi:lysophospholipid acyltransferase (LPLAT)-like uncharacterized protein